MTDGRLDDRRFARVVWPALIAGTIHLGLWWALWLADKPPVRARPSEVVMAAPLLATERAGTAVSAPLPAVRVHVQPAVLPPLPMLSWQAARPAVRPAAPAKPDLSRPEPGAGGGDQPELPKGAGDQPASPPGVTAVPTPPDDPELERYLMRLRLEIQRRLVYPAAARRLALEGEVVVRLPIGADGHPDGEGARIVGGADQNLLQEGALATVRRLGDLPAPPKGALTVDLPIRFALSGH